MRLEDITVVSVSIVSPVVRNLVVHPGKYNGVDSFYVLECFPGEAEDGTCRVVVLAACASWEAMIAAHELLR